jgi:hypothetical protein
MPGTEVAQRTAIDWMSEQTGVVIAEVEGKRLISIPPSLHEKVNLLTPVSQVQQVDANFSPAPRLVQLDPNPDNGDVYPESGKFALTAKALAKVADVAGIEQVRSDADDMGGKGVRYKVVGRMRGPDGIFREKPGTKTVRWAALERRVRRETLGKNASATEEYIAKRIDDEMEHVDSKCETKAWNRVIRGFLAVKSTYTKQELKKPFLAITWAFTPDLRSPMAREIIQLQYTGALSAVYGGEGDAPPAIEAPAAAGALDAGDWPEDGFDADDDTDDESGGDDVDVEVLDAEDIIDNDEHSIDADTGEVFLEPDTNFLVNSGPYAGQHASDVVKEKAGVRWLASTVKRMKADSPKRKLARDWIAFAEGHEPTDEYIEHLIAGLGGE